MRERAVVSSILALLISSTAAQPAGSATLPFAEDSVPVQRSRIDNSFGEKTKAEGGKIDEYLLRLAGFGFSGAVLVAKDGQVLIENGYGMADRKRNLQFTAETVFDIGSNTKDFTKMAILQLAEKKLISLDDTINKFFDQVPADKAMITVQQLMDHTAGFGMYSGRDDEKVTKDEFLRRVLSAPLISEPGKKNNYSNPGYGLLAAIIEKVSEQSYEQYVQGHIFAPAAMAFTGYSIPKRREGQIAHTYAEGEDRGSTYNIPHIPDGVSWSLRGAGGTLSTLGDMYKFHLALERERLLSKEFKAKLFDMESPMVLVGGNGVHYFVYQREPANHVVVLIASSDAGLRATEINQQIAALAAGRDVPLPPKTARMDPAMLAKLAGNYKLASGAELTVSIKGDRLLVSGANQEGFDLLVSGRPGNPEQINKMNDQVRVMLEAAAKGDYVPTYKVLSAAMPFEEFKPRQEALWQRRKDQFGQFKQVTILGTVPGQGNLVTTARLDFDHGVDYAQFMWGGGVIRGIRPSVAAPGVEFFPQSATDFVKFNPNTGESTNISFKPNESGNGFSVSLQPGQAAGPSGPGANQKAKVTKLPDTPAGSLVSAYLKAFNSGDEKVAKDFFLNYLSKTSLANRSMEERLGIYRQMRDNLGDLQVESVDETSPQAIALTAQTKDGVVQFRFEMDPSEPGKLKGLRVERN